MERIESITLALKNEQTEMEFYRGQAKRSKNSLAKTMFTMLAKDEEEHMKRIQGLHGKLVADKKWPKDVPLEVNGTDIAMVLVSIAGPQAAAQHDDDDVQAIEKAIAFEAKGEEFYRKIAGLCDNPQEKEFFTFLSGIEREHHLSLVESLAFLKDPQSWMMEHERANLDGA